MDGRAAALAARRHRDVAVLHPDAARRAVRRATAGIRLASGLINTSYQAGSALGLAAATALATSYSGIASYQRPFMAAAAIAGAAAVLALAAIRRPTATTEPAPSQQPALVDA